MSINKLITRFDSINATDAWAALPSEGCSVVTIQNLSGVDMQCRRVADTSKVITIKAGMAYPLSVTNASEIQLRRASGSTSVPVELIYD